MTVNSDKISQWKSDIKQSVDLYNNWFLKFAPQAYRESRIKSTVQVEQALKQTKNLTRVTVDVLKKNPSVLAMLRMTTAPPIARDRLIGLADVSKNLVINMEDKKRIPPRMEKEELHRDLEKISELIMRLADKDIFPWLELKIDPREEDIYRAATIIADRLCGAQSDPIIRNAQEKRQLDLVRNWLEQREYLFVEPSKVQLQQMKRGTFSFHYGVPVNLSESTNQVKVSVDIIIMPKTAPNNSMPLLIEAKSAGDYTNPNKRRKEEAIKMSQINATYGKNVRYILLLCGYFDSGYLGYEAAEGIDWIWEHRLDDLSKFGL